MKWEPSLSIIKISQVLMAVSSKMTSLKDKNQIFLINQPVIIRTNCKIKRSKAIKDAKASLASPLFKRVKWKKNSPLNQYLVPRMVLEGIIFQGSHHLREKLKKRWQYQTLLKNQSHHHLRNKFQLLQGWKKKKHCWKKKCCQNLNLILANRLFFRTLIKSAPKKRFKRE